MEPNHYSFILKLTALIISFLLIIFGFYLAFKRNTSKSGTLAFGSLKIRNSTAGMVFVVFGAVTLIYSIGKGVGMDRKTKVTERRREFDTLGRKTVEIETIKETADSAAAMPVSDQ